MQDHAPGSIWEQSEEFRYGYSMWSLNTYEDRHLIPWVQSQEYRDARLAFKRRINGRTKADH